MISDADIDRFFAAFQPTEKQFPPKLPTPSIKIGSEWARKAFDEEIARVLNSVKGERNVNLNRAAFSLSQLVAGGHLSESETIDALRSAASSIGLARPEIEATIRSGMTAGRAQPRVKPNTIIPVPFAVVEAVAGMVAKVVPVSAPPLGRDVDWTRPSGLLGEMAGWILATSPMPNRPLAVAAATAVISTVCGRHLYSASGTAMSLYIACLARTGVGKDRPFSAVSEILHACGLSMLHTTAKTFSVSGFEAMIVDSPCVVATVDEMGANLLKRISHWKASSQEEAIKGMIQELWSRVLGKPPFLTTRRATSRPIEVHSPSLTIFGASTPDAFYEAMKGGDVMNGFLNRFLIATADPRSEEDDEIEPRPVPQLVIDSLVGLIPELDGNIGGLLGVFSGVTKIPERKLEWDDGVRPAVRAWKKYVNEIIDSGPLGELCGRTYEYTIRLAGIHAVSRAGAGARVGMDDLHWGAAWALGSARAMMDAAENLMSKSDYEVKLNDIKAAIKKAGSITRSNLLRSIRHIDARDLENITNHLAEAGMILKLEVKPAGGAGRPAKTYEWAK